MTIISFPVFSEDVLLPEEEAPEHFLDIGMDSADVMLFVTGSWKIGLYASYGFGWSENYGFDYTASYPGLNTGFSFEHSPDFTASLNILDRYLFETTFTDDLEESTFMLGYRGKENEFLQDVSLGNMGLDLQKQSSMSDYYFVPDGSYSAFGAYTRFQSPFSTHELLLRFDPEEELSKIYIGSDLVTEIELEPYEYLVNRYFIVPNGPSDAVFYIETSKDMEYSLTMNWGDSLRYFIECDSSEYSYNPGTGMLVFNSEPDGAVIALSSDFSWTSMIENPYVSSPVKTLADYSEITTAGTVLMLSDPGTFSPFQSCAAYSFGSSLPDDSYKTRVYLAEDVSSLSSALEPGYSADKDAGIILLKTVSGSDVRYPLYNLSGGYSRIYGPDAESGDGFTGRKVIIQTLEEQDSYSIDDAVDGSVRIYINGIKNTDWALSSSGVITFNTQPSSTDRIVINYHTQSSLETGSDILFASANTFSITPAMTAGFDTGLKWNITSGKYSEYDGQNTGMLYAAADLSYLKEFEDSGMKIEAGLQTAVKLETTNTNGLLRLRDMNESGLSINFSGKNIYPASPSGIIDGGLTNANRGILYYKDYRYTASSSTYQDYNTEIDESFIYNPADSKAADMYKSGPYIASIPDSDGIGITNALILDYELADSTEWVGMQLPLNKGGSNQDMSMYKSFSFYMKSEGDVSDLSVYIEAGSVAEDLDADGYIGEESSEYSEGFIFNDPNTSSGTLIGGDNQNGSNDVLDSEDINDNGIADREKTDSIAIFESGTDFQLPGTGWKKIRCYFTDSGAAAFSRLKDSEFVRISVKSNTAAAEGRLMFADFKFEGSSMFANIEGSYTAPEYSEIYEEDILSSEAPDEALSTDYIGSESNRVLRIDWDSDWNMYSYIEPVDSSNYRSLSFYYHAPALSGDSNLGVRITDGSSNGYEMILPISETSVWHKVEVNYTDLSVYIDGVLSADTDITVSGSPASFSLIEFFMDDTAGGTVFIDEVNLEDSVYIAGAGISANFSINSGKAVLKAGDTEIIGVTSFSENAAFDLSDNGTDNYEINSQSVMTTSILGSNIKTSLGVYNSQQYSRYSGYHSLKVPVAGSSLVINDVFQSADTSADDFSKTDSVVLNLPWLTGELAGFTASLSDDLLLQDWNSTLNLSFGSFYCGASAAMVLSGSGYNPGWNGYFDGWLNSFGLMLPYYTGENIERSSAFSLNPGIKTVPAGFETSITLSGSVDSDNIKTDTFDMDMAVPISLPDEVWGMTARIGYSRNADFTYDTKNTLIQEDIDQLFTTVSEQAYLFTSVPGYELFSESLSESFYDSCNAYEIDYAELTNSLYLTLNRKYSSRLMDLFLPSFLDISITGTTVKDYLELESDLSLDFTGRSTALNLFGQAGAHSLTNLWYSDEYSWSATAILSGLLNTQPVQEYGLGTSAVFYTDETESISFETASVLPVNNEDVTGSFEAAFTWSWNRIPEKPIDLPFFSPEEEALEIFTNEELMVFAISDSYDIELKHTTALTIFQTFTLSAYVTAGLSYENSDDGHIWLFGTGAGISGSVMY